MRLRKSEQGVTLLLNRDMYGKDAIDSTLRSFSRICNISVKPDKTNYVVQLSGLEYDDLEGVALEFANYALAATKSA